MSNKLSKFEKLKQNLTKRHQKVKEDFEKKQVKALKWLSAKNLSLPDIYQATTRLLTTGSLAGTLLLSGTIQPPFNLPTNSVEIRGLRAKMTNDKFYRELANNLTALLPADIGKVSPDKEKQICNILEKYLGFNVCFRYQGNELNYYYAWTGYEQHLYRYPGDSLEQHDDELVAGIAPGLGAYGYFSETKEKMTQEDYLREKYYVAVQTLYLPEFNMDPERVYEWYRYRKVMMVNPENGRAVVAVVGDAGPAEWTGKQFGGSPEVMKSLNLHQDWRKGKVLLLFVDDPDNKIPLGPVEALSSINLAKK
jgi:hypothetical protein